MRYTILSTSFLVTARKHYALRPAGSALTLLTRFISISAAALSPKHLHPCTPQPKATRHYDRIVCHIEGPHRSYRWERTTNSGSRSAPCRCRRTRVSSFRT